MKKGQLTRVQALNPWITVVFTVLFSIMVCLTICVAQMRWEIQGLSTELVYLDGDIRHLNRRLLKQEYPVFVKPFKEPKIFALDFHIKY